MGSAGQLFPRLTALKAKGEGNPYCSKKRGGTRKGEDAEAIGEGGEHREAGWGPKARKLQKGWKPKEDGEEGKGSREEGEGEQ